MTLMSACSGRNYNSESACTASKSQLTLAQIRENYQTAGPIGTKFGTHVQIHMGMDIRQTNCPSRHKGGLRGVNNSKVWESCPTGTNFGSRLRIHLGMDIG